MLNCLAGIRRRRIRGREVWCLKARAHSLLFLWTSFVSVYCLSVSSYQLTCCEISHFYVMAMHLFSWSFLLQRSFSWRWYIGLLIGLLSPPVFSFSWSVVLPHPNSHVSVCLCTPMIHSPQSCFSHCDHTADHHAEFPNCHKNCFFHFFPPFWTTAHTFPGCHPDPISIWNDRRVKKAWMQRDHVQVLFFLPPPPLSEYLPLVSDTFELCLLSLTEHTTPASCPTFSLLPCRSEIHGNTGSVWAAVMPKLLLPWQWVSHLFWQFSLYSVCCQPFAVSVEPHIRKLTVVSHLCVWEEYEDPDADTRRVGAIVQQSAAFNRHY